MRMGSYTVAYYTEADVLEKITIKAEDEFEAEKDVRKKLTASNPDIDEDEWLIDDVQANRPSEDEASQAIYDYLCEVMGKDEVDASSFEMHPDGSGWQFWVREEDTTSYVHHNLGIEWYGTGWTWEDAEDDDETTTVHATEAAAI